MRMEEYCQGIIRKEMAVRGKYWERKGGGGGGVGRGFIRHRSNAILFRGGST